MKKLKNLFFLFVAITFIFASCAKKPPKLSGELKKWHKITLTFDGPRTSEDADYNPFLNYRLNVKFTKGDKSFLVPGYFAADGNAANTSATSGNKWRVHFCPDDTGRWHYEVDFRRGKRVATDAAPLDGRSGGYMDGYTGFFVVEPSDKSGRDFRGKGRLEYIGGPFLRFAGTGEYFLKSGADAPENFLAYRDFDGTFKSDSIKDELVKDWGPHVKDWQPGDPVWQDDKGKGMIGALNYLASKGMNVFSFLPMNIEGDDRNVFPYTSYDERLRMDVSKLDQWEIVFEHADKLGLYLHFKTQEAENQKLLDGGDLGVERKLYYRELIARFSHHLALNWNLGEENGSWGQVEGQTTEQRKAMAQYFYENDPYHHHIVIHNGQSFDDLLGDASKLTGASVQTHKPDFSLVHSMVLEWRQKSAEAGKPWVIAVDEPGDASHALITDAEDPTHDNARKNALWGMWMAGGAGIEWYFGYQHPHSDLTCQDWRTRENMWDQCRYALDFFKENKIPLQNMINDDEKSTNNDSYCLYLSEKIYIVYLKNGGRTALDLKDAGGEYQERWFNPRNGQYAQKTARVRGGESVILGPPPKEPAKDWVVWLEKE